MLVATNRTDVATKTETARLRLEGTSKIRRSWRLRYLYPFVTGSLRSLVPCTSSFACRFATFPSHQASSGSIIAIDPDSIKQHVDCVCATGGHEARMVSSGWDEVGMGVSRGTGDCEPRWLSVTSRVCSTAWIANLAPILSVIKTLCTLTQLEVSNKINDDWASPVFTLSSWIGANQPQTFKHIPLS